MVNNCTLGGTIPLPGFSNIKVEVSGNGYSQTKEYLRLVVMQFVNTPETRQAVETWWKMTFGTYIYDDIMKT